MKDSYIKKFDSVYGSRDCYYGFELRNEFLDYFDKKDLKNVEALDLGCGEGRYSVFLAQKGCSVFSIDRSGEGIKKLKKMAQHHRLPIHAEVLDIEYFIVEKNRFDIIVAATVLDHLSDGLRQQTIRAIKESLKPGGILYVNVFTVSDPGFAVRTGAGDGSSATHISDTADCMEYYFKPGELAQAFDDLIRLYYYEGIEPDLSHGSPHDHGWACLLAEKPERP